MIPRIISTSNAVIVKNKQVKWNKIISPAKRLGSGNKTTGLIQAIEHQALFM
jgi:hypothetical protein